MIVGSEGKSLYGRRAWTALADHVAAATKQGRTLHFLVQGRIVHHPAQGSLTLIDLPGDAVELCQDLDERLPALLHHIAQGAQNPFLIPVEIGYQLIDIGAFPCLHGGAGGQNFTLVGTEVEAEKLSAEKIRLPNHRHRIFLDAGSIHNVEVDADLTVLDADCLDFPHLDAGQANRVTRIDADGCLKICNVLVVSLKRMPVLDQLDHHCQRYDRRQKEQAHLFFRGQGHLIPPP